MSPVLRGVLVFSAFIVLIFVCRKLRKAQFSTSDSLFWLLTSLCLFLAALFPKVVFFFSNLMGFQAPSNFIILAVIALLLIKEFTMQAEISKLRSRVKSLTQEMALKAHKQDYRDNEL